jgi:hypothetical protein
MQFTNRDAFRSDSNCFWKGSLTKLWWIVASGLSVAVTVVIVVVALQKDATPESNLRLAKMGEVVSIGDLDLTILSTAPFTAARYSLSNANYAVRFRATNARGGAGKPYELAHTDMKIIDNTGTTRETVPCVQCPGVTGDDISLKLARGETVEGTFYYKLPPGMQPMSVTYHSLLSDLTAKVHVTSTSLQGAAPVAAR